MYFLDLPYYVRKAPSEQQMVSGQEITNRVEQVELQSVISCQVSNLSPARC